MVSYCLGHGATAPLVSIRDPHDALALILHADATSPGDKIVAIVLDHRDRVISLLTVTSPPDADGLFGVLEAIGRRNSAGLIRGVILASCRGDHGLDADDADRWMEASDLCTPYGIDLVEWFVVGPTIVCPRDILGEPPRWRTK